MANSTRTELMGEREFARRMQRATAETITVMAASLYTTGNLIMMVSQTQVPFRTGALKASGRVFEPAISGTRVEVELSYGGDASAYAQYVHDRDLHFQNGKKNHYLSDPVVQGGGALAGLMASRLRSIL